MIFFVLITVFSINFISVYSIIKDKEKELNKIKVKICIFSQKVQLEFMEEKIQMILKNKDIILNDNSSEKKMILDLAFCFNKINFKEANQIYNSMKSGNYKDDEITTEIKKIIDTKKQYFENIEKTQKEKIFYDFIQTFDLIYQEIKKEERINKPDYTIYFISTPLFKFFCAYIIINTIIIFTKRIVFPPKLVEDFSENEDINELEGEKDIKNNIKENQNELETRKLIKKKKIGIKSKQY